MPVAGRPLRSSRNHPKLTRLARALIVVPLAVAVAPLLGVSAASASTPALSAFTAGDVVTYDVAGTSSAAAAVDLDEYAPAGTGQSPAGQVAMPTADSGTAHALTDSGSASSDGELSLSEDGKYLLVTGYDAAPGTASVTGTSASSAARVLGEVDANADVNTTTAVSDFSKNNIRSAAATTGGPGAGVYLSGASGGIIYTTVGSTGSSYTTLSSNSSRQLNITDNQLYVSADPTKSPPVSVATVGTGLPASGSPAVTNLSFSTSPVEPYGYSLLTLGPGATPDTLYVADNGSGSNASIEKFCLTGGTWQGDGSVAIPNVTGVTANDANGNGVVSVYATSPSGLYEITDASGLCGPLSGSATQLASAPSGTTFLGVAFAPGTTIGSGGGATPPAAPTITTAAAGLAAALQDPTSPSTSITIGDTTDPVTDVQVTASSSNASVVANSGIAITGSGTVRTVTVTPAGAVGTSTITFTATDSADGLSSTATIQYGVSPFEGDPSQRYYSDAGNGSTEIDAGDGYMIVGDDESNVLRLYNEADSGPPVKTFDFTSIIGTKEIDIEASARVGNTLYWTGSMSNNSDGTQEPTRSTLFAATITGSGASTNLTFLGDYTGLQSDLVSWDENNGSGLGANYLGFAAASAAGMTDHAPDAFNVEGMEFAPGSSTTAYLAFRAPLEPYGNGGSTEGSEAVLVPVTNINSLVSNGESTTAGPATFGKPVFWNLGSDPSTGLGLGIREIRDNPACATSASQCDYLIIAGTSDGSNDDFELYSWDGVASDPPLLSPTSLPVEPASPNQGAWEGIVSVPDGLQGGDQVELVQDDGDVDWYDIGETSKTGLLTDLQKDMGQAFTYAMPAALASATSLSSSANPATAGSPVTYTATVTGPSGTLGTPTGTVSFNDDGSPVAGCGSVTLPAAGSATCTTTYQAITTDAITVSYSGDGSFAPSSSANLSEQVNGIPVTITADNQSITYGQPDPAFTYLVSGLNPGDSLATSPACGVSGDHSAAGSYPITCSGAVAPPMYAVSYVPGTLTVGQATIDVTPVSQAITYGDADPAYTFSVSGLVGDDSAPSGISCGVSGAHSDAGSYTISCTGPSSSDSYQVDYGTATLTVNPKTVTIEPAAQSVTYGSGYPGFGYTTAGFLGNDSLTSPATCGVAGSPAAVGDYTITCSGGTADANYTLAYGTAAFDITPATVTIVPDNQSITFGEANPAFTYSVSGLVGNDALVTNPACGVTGDDSAVGSYPITCSGADAGPDYTVDESATATLTVNEVTAAITTTADNNPAVTGQPVTFTATVAPAIAGQGGGAVPTGTAEFSYEGSDIPGCSAVALSGGSASCPVTSGFAAGSGPVTVTYSGDGTFSGASDSSLTETVRPAASSATLSADNTSVVAGQPVTLTATVAVTGPGTASPVSPGGTVAFSAGGTTIPGCGAVPLNATSGTAQCLDATGFAPPSATVAATYSGDGNFAGSIAAPLTVTVAQDTPAVTVTASPATPVPGEAYVITANLAATAPGSGTPGGTAAFVLKASKGTTPACAGGNTVTLTGGSASCTIAASAITANVTYTATVNYSGDASFTSASGSLAATAAMAPSIVALTSSANPAVSGAPVTLKATVSTSATKSGSYAGTTTFEILGADGSTASCKGGNSVTTSGATASCVLPAGALDAAASPYEVTASYSGNANYGPSAAALSQAVSLDATTTTVTISPKSLVTDEAATLRAVISPAAHLSLRPGGIVTFSVTGQGGDQLTCTAGDAAQVVAATAYCALAPGLLKASDAPYSVNASYSGDPNYAASSTASSVTVAPRATRLTLRSSASPVAPNDRLTFSATLAPANHDLADVAGSVTFSIGGGAVSCDGGNVAALVNDVATCDVPAGALAPSSTYAVTAVYAGSGDYGASSAALTERTSK